MLRLPPTPFRQDPQTRRIAVCPFNLHNKLPRLIFGSLPPAKIIENRCRVVQNRQKSKFARLPCSSSLLASFYDPFGVKMNLQKACRNWYPRPHVLSSASRMPKALHKTLQSASYLAKCAHIPNFHPLSNSKTCKKCGRVVQNRAFSKILPPTCPRPYFVFFGSSPGLQNGFKTLYGIQTNS